MNLPRERRVALGAVAISVLVAVGGSVAAIGIANCAAVAVIGYIAVVVLAARKQPLHLRTVLSFTTRGTLAIGVLAVLLLVAVGKSFAAVMS